MPPLAEVKVGTEAMRTGVDHRDVSLTSPGWCVTNSTSHRDTSTRCATIVLTGNVVVALSFESPAYLRALCIPGHAAGIPSEYREFSQATTSDSR